MARDEHYARMIHTARWQRLRLQALRAHPLCQDCERRGLASAACEVHHARPVESGATRAEMERLMFDPANLRALCHACHVRAHEEMGRGGKAAAKRRSRAQAGEAISRFFGGAAGEGGPAFLSGEGGGPNPAPTPENARGDFQN